MAFLVCKMKKAKLKNGNKSSQFIKLRDILDQEFKKCLKSAAYDYDNYPLNENSVIMVLNSVLTKLFLNYPIYLTKIANQICLKKLDSNKKNDLRADVTIGKHIENIKGYYEFSTFFEVKECNDPLADFTNNQMKGIMKYFSSIIIQKFLDSKQIRFKNSGYYVGNTTAYLIEIESDFTGVLKDLSNINIVTAEIMITVYRGWNPYYNENSK